MTPIPSSPYRRIELPISPDQVLRVGRVRFPAVLGTNGNALARISWSYNSEIYNTIDGAIAEDPLDLIPSWSQTNCSLATPATTCWETRLIARNLFDEQGINWLSTTAYGDDLPAFRIDRFHYCGRCRSR
jgi:hypothetical protein